MNVDSEAEKIEKKLKDATGLSLKLICAEGEDAVFYKGKAYMVVLDGKSPTKKERLLIQYILSGFEAEKSCGKEESLKNILFGESEFAVFRFKTRYRIPDVPCCAVLVYLEKHQQEAFAHVERCIEGGRDLLLGIDNKHFCVVKFLGEEQTSYEFALFLAQSIYEELGVHARIGVGEEEKSFGDISRSYQQAVAAVRMSENFRTGSDVHLYRDFMLVRMLEEVPRTKLEEYFSQFRFKGAEEIFQDEELLDTAERFLEYNLNVSETSRSLFMHRNTLLYRLDKIENATGLNIRNFSDAVTFRIIAVIYKLLNIQ